MGCEILGSGPVAQLLGHQTVSEKLPDQANQTSGGGMGCESLGGGPVA